MLVAMVLVVLVVSCWWRVAGGGLLITGCWWQRCWWWVAGGGLLLAVR